MNKSAISRVISVLFWPLLCLYLARMKLTRWPGSGLCIGNEPFHRAHGNFKISNRNFCLKHGDRNGLLRLLTLHLVWFLHKPSSETQGQIVGARESLNGRKNMARRKVKNGEKSPWGQCLTRPVPNGRRRSGFWLGRKTQKFSGTNQKPERPRQFGTGLVRHCPQGLFSQFFTFLRAIFSCPFRLFLASTICPLGLRGCSQAGRPPTLCAWVFPFWVLVVYGGIDMNSSATLCPRFLINPPDGEEGVGTQQSLIWGGSAARSNHWPF